MHHTGWLFDELTGELTPGVSAAIFTLLFAPLLLAVSVSAFFELAVGRGWEVVAENLRESWQDAWMFGEEQPP